MDSIYKQKSLSSSVPGKKSGIIFSSSRIVEVISGEKIDDYFKENIFDPLGMKDTGFIVPKKDADRLTALYFRTPEKKLVLEDPSGNESNMLINKTYKGGGSGLASTIEDYFKFSQMLLNGGELNGKRIDYFPTSVEDFEKCIPIFKKLPGWRCSTENCRRLEDLPPAAMSYLRFLAELMEVPIAIVSLGANRDQTIVIEDPIHGPKRALLNS